MRIFRFSIGLAVIISLMLPLGTATAGGDDNPYTITSVPREMSYQGILKDSAGDPVEDSVYSITFRIFNVPSGGISMWDETLPCTTTAGVFTAMFSNVSLPFDEDYWLEMEIASEILDPRQKMGMVGYAAVSDTADFAQRVATVDGATGGTVFGDVNIQSLLNIFGDISVTDKATIGPGHTNTGERAFVAGESNTASGDWSTVGGGSGDTASGDYSAVGGGLINIAGGAHSTIAGGFNNHASGDESFVGGGLSNTASGARSVVGGGTENIAESSSCVVGGGVYNEATNYAATIGGGRQNKARGEYSVVGGGGGIDAADSNAASGNHSMIGGGSMNRAGAEYCTISGGKNNLTVHEYATVGGGENNRAHWQHTTVGGGKDNVAGDWYSVVAGGLADSAHGQYNTIGGGQFNTTNGLNSTIGGGMLNIATSDYSVVGGGRDNVVYGLFSAIPGGFDNTITGTADYSYLFGIGSNMTQDSTFMVDMPHIRFGDEADGYEFPAADGDIGQILATDGAGKLNWDYIEGGNWTVDNSVLYTDSFWGIARGEADNALLGSNVHTMVNLGVACTTGVASSDPNYVTVSGGYGNVAKWRYSTVCGGQGNIADGSWATIGGGGENIADGQCTTIGGGAGNIVSAQYSTICGGIYNINEGEHSVIPGGGWDTLTTNAEMAMAFGGGVYVDHPWHVVFFDGEFPGRFGLNRDDRNGGVNWPIHVGTDAGNGNGAYLTFSGLWISVSSREYKENFQQFDSEALLGKIADLDIETWQYIGSDEKHVGPYAEEFNEAFGTGAVREDGTLDTKGIAANDVAGVALAGVKELINIIKELKSQNAELEMRIAQLEAERK